MRVVALELRSLVSPPPDVLNVVGAEVESRGRVVDMPRHRRRRRLDKPEIPNDLLVVRNDQLGKRTWIERRLEV